MINIEIRFSILYSIFTALILIAEVALNYPTNIIKSFAFHTFSPLTSTETKRKKE